MPHDLTDLKERALAYAEKHVPQKPLLTIAETAKAAGMSPRWVRLQIQKGKIPFVRQRGKRAIYRDTVVELLTEST
jgi:excisionase family DNA binding protein